LKKTLQRLLPFLNVLVAISKGMQTVKLCTNKILHFVLKKLHTLVTSIMLINFKILCFKGQQQICNNIIIKDPIAYWIT